jgi:hypothetical protein
VDWSGARPRVAPFGVRIFAGAVLFSLSPARRREDIARERRSLPTLRGFFLVALVVAIQAPGQTIAPASGKAMCSALTPDDFIKAGVPVSQLREANLDDEKIVYCVYDSKAGEVELDMYYPAGDTPGEAQNSMRAVQGAIGGKFEAVQVAGSEEASTNARPRKVRIRASWCARERRSST